MDLIRIPWQVCFSSLFQHVCVPYDIGTTLSYVSEAFVNVCRVPKMPTNMYGAIKSPLGVRESINKVCRNAKIVIADKLMPIDLLVLDMGDFDVILGIDWLGKHNVIIDCALQRLSFCFPGEEHFEYNVELQKPTKLPTL